MSRAKRGIDLDDITAAAVGSFADLPDPRRREPLLQRVQHLHGFARAET